MKVIDVIKNNDADIVVKVKGENPINDCDPWSVEYYFGKLGKIPKYLRNFDVLDISWLIGSDYEGHCISIPFISKGDYFPFG